MLNRFQKEVKKLNSTSFYIPIKKSEAKEGDLFYVLTSRELDFLINKKVVDNNK